MPVPFNRRYVSSVLCFFLYFVYLVNDEFKNFISANTKFKDVIEAN
jgi:hypothetical protein